ncbi:response regulator [Mucilaginibacter phyllosphaerae]
MKSIHILLIEDNEGDILLTTEAFENSKFSNEISVMRDGKVAIDFFGKIIRAEEIPDLILLDINLPKKNGHQVLQFIKESNQYNHLPVIMLTTSSSEADIHSAYKHHANCYITKPIDISEFMIVISKIEDFWTNIVSMPSKQC